MKAAFAITVVLAATSISRGGEKAALAKDKNVVATFSIVAADPATGEVGVAVASRFLAVGTVVPWAKAGVGAVATQSRANVAYGPRGLALLAAGMSPEKAIEKLTSEDSEAGFRQVGIVNAAGESATYTGEKCIPFAMEKKGKNYAVQGNLLATERVTEAMARRFEESEGPLPLRLLEALEAGEGEGGDARGKQSAALLVVRRGWGFLGNNDRFRDLRVDDHEDPVTELRRIYELHRKMFPRPERPKDDGPAEK